MFDLTFGILMLVVALFSTWLLKSFIESDRYYELGYKILIELSVRSLILGISLFLGVKYVKMSGNGILLSDKALVKYEQYSTVCTGKSADRQVAILEDTDGLRAYELQKIPPRIFSFTGNMDRPYEEAVIMTHEELAKKLNEMIKALKNAQRKKALQKSTTTQNGH